VAPTLNWLKQKQAQIARAQLESLYTPEELEEMFKSINNTT
jgi:SAM-dependent MidA family methyltransferase